MAQTEIVAEPGVPQIVIAREFAAPPELLFRAHTDPDLLAKWLGPRDLTMTVNQFDARHGGTWRYVQRDAGGAEYGFRGVFHGTPSPEAGIVQTFEFEGMPGHVSMETLTFEPRGDRTLVRAVSVYQSVADRDGMVESGMEVGLADSYARLDELLARLVPVA